MYHTCTGLVARPSQGICSISPGDGLNSISGHLVILNTLVRRAAILAPCSGHPWLIEKHACAATATSMVVRLRAVIFLLAAWLVGYLTG